ncbi:MAG: methyltransferase domain-containing protein [Polyangiaceae bacterium]
MNDYSQAVNTARDYYNSEDADAFYATIWGGEDIHIGLYESLDESITDASRRTVEHMATKLTGIGRGDRVLDVGSGYGGAARHLAKSLGCRVSALNLSEVENARARELTAEQGLDELVEVIDGSFEAIPFGAETFDAVWSQDAILHSGNRDRVLAEVARVMKPGARFVFTDPMQADDCPDGVLEPILSRIHLETLGSPSYYERAATEVGLRLIDFENLTHQLCRHYQRVLDETSRREGDLEGTVSAAYIDRMKRGLRHWIDGGRRGHLAWGVFLFEKAA